MQVPDLRRMGADIHQDRNHAIVKGVKNLEGATVVASDLRAGAALVIAGLMAKGQTIVEKLHHIDRGYEAFETKLSALGAKIVRFNDEDVSLNTNLMGVSNASRL
jgi:UDP-N-acetylglucosamine 1-carboxyvinyltransferase